ncbi:hypothetical protein EI94DRAFT_1805870 [Lactarius quietus]|nr:hypothetical protein EI94DRAFT_1805870 [Lactarius quietus]
MREIQIHVARILGSQASSALASKVDMLEGLDKILGFLKPLQLASAVAEALRSDDLASAVHPQDTSEELIKYAAASQSTLEFLAKNWYNSNKGKVDTLKEEARRLEEHVNTAINIENMERLRLFHEQQRLTNEQQRLAEEQRMLDRIKPPEGSFFDPDSKNCCMENTRANLIETLVSFAVSDDTSQRLFLLSGIAGCGKSSVATTVANLLHQRDCLLGSFFFQTDSEKMRIPANFLHTVAYSMASRYEPYKKALVKVMKEDTMVEQKSLLTQFDTLLRKPLSKILKTSSTNTSHLPSNRAEIVGLAPWLKIIVTSRPLDDVVENHRRAGYITHVDLFTVDASEDILNFTQSRFDLGGPLQQLQSQVTKEDIKALAKKSHGLFIWIKTVLSYLDDFPFTSDKLEELKSILSSPTAPSPEKELDQLYLRVLRGVARSQHYQVAVKNFVGFIYTTSRNRPLPCTGLHAFIPTHKPNSHVTPDDVHHLQSKLAAVITIDQVTKALQVCHPSFLDFVSSEERSQEFSTKPEVLDTMMAERCLSLLKAGQKSDICGREYSRDEIPVLQQIPQELHYSAVYWLDHLSRSRASGSSDEKLIAAYKDAYEFLNHGGLLYLLNVLNSVSEFDAASQVLIKFSDVISETGLLTHRPKAELFNRIRLLTIGRSGVGKSSLINRVFGIRLPLEVEAYKPGEPDIQQEYVSPENQLFVLHDSKGFEPGDLSNFETVCEFLLQRSRQEMPPNETIHSIWLCIETSPVGGRVHEIGDEKLLKFAHEKQIPIVLVFTQYDRLVRTKEFQLRGIRDMDLTHRRERSVEEARKAFEETLRSLQSTMDQYRIPMPPYVTVSGKSQAILRYCIFRY